MGCLSVGYQQALGWLWGRIAVALMPHVPRMYLPCTWHLRLPIPSQSPGLYLPCTWLWAALPGSSRFGVRSSRFEVRRPPKPFRIQLASHASLGVVWGRPGHTLDMSYTHRTPSKPRFRSAELIQTTFLRHFRGGTIQVRGRPPVSGYMEPPALWTL